MTDTLELRLANHLKTLRLPTLLREHDKLARICAAESVDHVRYLVRLTELKLIDRERRMWNAGSIRKVPGGQKLR
jgi:hypothetical protein